MVNLAKKNWAGSGGWSGNVIVGYNWNNSVAADISGTAEMGFLVKGWCAFLVVHFLRYGV